MVIGTILASVLSRVFSRLRRGRHIDQNAAIAVQKTLFYVFLIIVFIMAVQVANLPLAFLTLLSAAVAIGASIGAKNIIYDYLSGLILALEKPVRMGACVEVENQRGFVTEISGRYTIIRRFDGIDVLVPNSTLLENNVVNWTLHDNIIRGDLNVGVVYSSPVRKVAQLIRQAIDANEEVLETPPPGVRFWDFGESSLVFWAWFWADVQNPMYIWRIQSEIRFRIVELFRENNISLALPQRDVYLDTRDAVNVQMAWTAPGGEEEPEKEQTPEASKKRENWRSEEAAQKELKPDGEENGENE